MVRVAGDLYLLGGGNGPQPQRKVFKLTEEGWSVTGETPAPRFYPSVVSVGPTIYVVAGGASMSDLDQCTDEVWALDVSTGGWKTMAPIPGPPRVIQAAAALGRSVYVFGGSTKEPGRRLRNLDDAYRFDTGSGRWTRLGPTPVAARALVGRTGRRPDLPLRRLQPDVSGNRLRIRSFPRRLHPGVPLRAGIVGYRVRPPGRSPLRNFRRRQGPIPLPGTSHRPLSRGSGRRTVRRIGEVWRAANRRIDSGIWPTTP